MEDKGKTFSYLKKRITSDEIQIKNIENMIKRITIDAYQVGLVFENRKLITVLEEGKHWITGAKKVEIYDQTKPFTPNIDLNILLQNEALASLLEVVEVKDNQAVLIFVNGNFQEVVLTGIYAYWKNIHKFSQLSIDLSKVEITENIPKYLFDSIRIKPLVRKFQVGSHEKGILFIDEKINSLVEAGTYYFWNNTIPIEIKKVDIRQQQLEISGQELLTKDKAALRINFFVTYQVVDAIKALVNNKDYDKQLYVTMQLALRAFVGDFTLDELLSKKDTIADVILEDTKAKIEALGLTVTTVGIRDVILPGDMKEIMNQVLVAEKKAQANSIMRREETASTRSLLNTAKLMEENEMLWKLKEMEYVEKIADKIGEITISGSGNIIGQLKEIFVK